MLRQGVRPVLQTGVAQTLSSGRDHDTVRSLFSLLLKQLRKTLLMRIKLLGIVELFDQLLPLRRCYQPHAPQLLRAVLQKTIYDANEMIEDLALMVVVEDVAVNVELDDQVVFSAHAKSECETLLALLRANNFVHDRND